MTTHGIFPAGNRYPTGEMIQALSTTESPPTSVSFHVADFYGGNCKLGAFREGKTGSKPPPAFVLDRGTAPSLVFLPKKTAHGGKAKLGAVQRRESRDGGGWGLVSRFAMAGTARWGRIDASSLKAVPDTPSIDAHPPFSNIGCTKNAGTGRFKTRWFRSPFNDDPLTWAYAFSRASAPRGLRENQCAPAVFVHAMSGNDGYGLFRMLRCTKNAGTGCFSRSAVRKRRVRDVSNLQQCIYADSNRFFAYDQGLAACAGKYPHPLVAL